MCVCMCEVFNFFVHFQNTGCFMTISQHQKVISRVILREKFGMNVGTVSLWLQLCA
jgi:hypothetical protein